jgi:hypothetical protein
LYYYDVEFPTQVPDGEGVGWYMSSDMSSDDIPHWTIDGGFDWYDMSSGDPQYWLDEGYGRMDDDWFYWSS